MSRYRHVIWDWNGTLFDDVDIVIDVMNGLLGRRSLPLLTRARYCEIFDFPVCDYYALAGLDLEAEPFAALAKEWIAGFEARWRSGRLHPEAHGVLQAVSDLGLSQSVLSASEEWLLGVQAAHFEVANRFESLVGIDNHHAESKIERGAQWLGEAGYERAEVLLVGDTTHDRSVAAALGIDVVLVDDGHQSRWRLEATGAPVLNSLVELLGRGGPLAASQLDDVAADTTPVPPWPGGWRTARL